MRLSDTFLAYTKMSNVKVTEKLTFPESAARTERVQTKVARLINMSPHIAPKEQPK